MVNDEALWVEAESAIRGAVGEIGVVGALEVLSAIMMENQADTRGLVNRLRDYTTSKELSPDLVRDIRKAVSYLSQH